MSKKVLAIVAVLLIIAIVALICLSMTKKAPVPTGSGDSGDVAVVSASGEEEITPAPVFKETDPYVANIPNEILDFYKEKIEAIEEKHKAEQEDLIKESPDYDVADLRNLKYDLVFFDDNNTPELVVTEEGYRTALYTYDAGKVIYAMQEEDSGDEYGWPYGAGGNHGYEYIPRENVLRNYDADYAGLVQYVSYYELNPETHHLVNKNEAALYETHYNDKNGNGEVDDDEWEPVVDEPTYFYGDKKLTEEEWKGYMVEGEYTELVGTKSAESILKALEGLINEK